MTSTAFHPVGHLTAIHRYPVKSMRGHAIASSAIDWAGIVGDRRWAWVKRNDHSLFPWLTARNAPSLLRYVPQFASPADPFNSPVVVTTPEGNSMPIDDPALHAELEELAGEPLHLLHLGAGTFDSMALSLMTTSALHNLQALIGTSLDPVRFRPNLVIETADVGDFPEDGWIGGALVFGAGVDAPQLRIVRPIPRCMIINLDPETTKQQPAVLRTVARERRNMAGVYGIPEALGLLAVGTPVFFIPAV